MTTIADVGRDVTVREITRTFDDYGDATETNSDSTIKAIIVPLSSDDKVLESGALKQYDAVGFFKATDTAKIKDGNKIIDGTVTYDITNVQPIYMSSTILHIEAELVALIES